MTYKNILLGKTKYLVLFLIAIQSILLALVAIFFTGMNYQNTWENYNKTAQTTTVYLQKLTQKQSRGVFDYFTSHEQLSIWTHRTETDSNGRGLNKIYIDVMGNPNGFADVTFKNKVLINQQQLRELLDHTDNTLTIGLDRGEDKVLYSLPRPLFTTPIVIDRLEANFQKSQSIAGIYTINGLENTEDKTQFLNDLSQITGISSDNLTKETFGSHIDHGIVLQLLGAGLIINAFVIFIFLLIFVLRVFKIFGSLILLGWSRATLWKALFWPFVLFSVYSSPILSLILWSLSGWSFLGLSSLFTIFAGACSSLILLGLILLLPSLLVFSVSALSALHQRIPYRLLLTSGLIFYLLVSGTLIFTSYALDSPLQKFMTNIRISREWKNVEDMYVISGITEGDDVGTYAGTTNTLEQDMYNLYQELDRRIPGVYLAQSEFLDETSLANLAANGIYQHVPRKAFWYLTYSYNYLQDMGIELSPEEITAIQSGARLYLLPDTFSSQEVETMEAFLQERITISTGDIKTAFTTNPRYIFKRYTPRQGIFTWPTNSQQETTSQDPIIFVASPENLYFMESANLFVSGYNGILKLRDKATLNQVEEIIKQGFPDLADNHLQFTTVNRYINGIQKDLGQTFYLFGGIIGLLIFTLLSVLWGLLLLYRLVYQEKIAVQYFLGFSFFNRYRSLFILILLNSLVQVIILTILGSLLGILLSLLALACQGLILYLSVFRKEQASLIKQFKG